MAFEMNEYYTDGTMKEYDVINPTEVFTESFSDKMREKKDRKKLLNLMRDAVIRIMNEIWRIFPRTATLFTCVVTREKGKWKANTWIYMTKDIRNEKPVNEPEYSKKFNISKDQLTHLKDVCTRTMEYIGRNSILDNTDIDILVVNVAFDGSANYRFGKKSSVAKSNYAKEIANEMNALPDNVDAPNLTLDDSLNDISDLF